MQRKIVQTCLFVMAILGIFIVLWLYSTVKPLENYGLQTYQTPNEQGYVLELVNTGAFKIELLDVKVNGEKPPGPVYLGIAFDINTFVSVSSNQDPNMAFMNIRDYPINPSLTGIEIQEALKKKNHTPIHYGLKIVNNDNESVKSVTIRYKYLGLTKTTTITKWFENS